MADDIAWLQQHILVCHIVREDRVAISETEGINLSRIANKTTGIVRRDFLFLDLMKMFLNLSIALEKEYHDKFIGTCIVDIVENMTGTAFLTRRSAQSYYRYILVSTIISTHKSDHALMESLNSDEAGLNILGIFHSDDIGLYMVTLEEQPILIRVRSSFVKILDTLAPFPALTFYTNTKTFLGEPTVVFVSHSTVSAS